MLRALILIILIAQSAFALDFPELEVAYEKGSGKVIGIINKTANRESNPLVIKSPATRKFDPKEVESLTIQSSDKFLNEKGSLLGIRNVSSELFPKNVKEDNLGTKVLRYEQRLQGVPVYGGEIVAQVNSNYEVLSTSGRMISDLKVNTTPKVSAEKAIKIAKKDMENRYGWRSALSVAKRGVRKDCRSRTEESFCVARHIKRFNKSNGFYSIKAPQLFIYSEDFVSGRDVSVGNLVWKLHITNLLEDSEEYYIDAASGVIIKSQETKHHETYRRVSDCSNFLGDGLCYSQKSAPAYPGYIFGRKGTAPVRGPNPVPGPLFGSTEVDEMYDLIPVLHDYYANTFNRNGANDKGGTGDVFCAVGETCVPGSGPMYVDETNMRVNSNGVSPTQCTPGGASFQWFPPALNFCRGSMTYDIVGHEYSHAVAWFDSFNPDNSFNSVLLGGGLSGTLNESFADVMGEAFEFSVTGSIDWKQGATSVSGTIRDLADPTSMLYPGESFTFPDRFNHPSFYCGSGDNGGVHINSTVPSKAAYLASEGGSFNGCTIQGIGLQKVEQIWYRALTVHFTVSTSFNQAYFAINQACSDLANANMHGITTFDCEQVNAALQAVEMDQGGRCSGIPAVAPECAAQTITPTPTATATNTATQTATNTSTAPIDPVITNTPEPTATNTLVVEATIASVPTETPPVACVSTALKPDVKVKGKNATLKVSAIKSNTYKFLAKPSAGKTLSKSIKAAKNGKLSHTFKNLKEGQWDFSYSVKVKKVTTTSCPVHSKI